MLYYKPIIIQVQDPETEEWTDKLRLHASVNKTGGGTSYSAGADQHTVSLTFRLRYVKALEEIAYNPQPYRVVYSGRAFKVVDYDDYMEQHREVKLVGELYG
jgi:SPP1 family predicted phage head-tail adaptor